VVEGNETCDNNCPTSCDDSNACTLDSLVGSAVNCSAQCLHQTISQCTSGDGCCPAGCNHGNDTDCTGTAAIGAACTQGSDCAAGACITQDTSGWSAGYCSLGCTTDGECGAGNHCGAKDLNGNGVCLKTCTVVGDCRMHYTCVDAEGDGSKECYPTGDGDGTVGGPCSSTGDCAGGPNALCEQPSASWKNGYCSLGCNADFPCPSGSQCAAGLGICIKSCTGAADCRGNGYECLDALATGTKVCVNSANGVGKIGDPCAGIWDCGGGANGGCISGGYVGGYCSVFCAAGQGTCGTGTSCVPNAVGTASLCYKDCTTVAQCRTGYQCKVPTSTVTSLECAP